MYYSVFNIIFSFPPNKNLFLAYAPVLSLQVSGLHCACRSAIHLIFRFMFPISYSINSII